MGSTNSTFENEIDILFTYAQVGLGPATRENIIASTCPRPGEPASYIDFLKKQNGEPYNKVPVDLVQVEQKLAKLISDFQTLKWAEVRIELVRAFDGVAPTNESLRYALDRVNWIYQMVRKFHPNGSVLEELRLCERLIRLGRTDPQAIPPMEEVD